MPTCKKCGNGFPNTVKIDRKRRNISSRIFCLDCSPFGKHNTKDLTRQKSGRDYYIDAPCLICGSKTNKKGFRMRICHVCYNRKRAMIKGNTLYSIVGEKCWICGYGKDYKTRQMLDFHHMYNSNKVFGLTSRNVGQMSFDTVINEAKKCILVCCRCHREIHAGLIPHDDAVKIYKTVWCKTDRIDLMTETCDNNSIDAWIDKVDKHWKQLSNCRVLEPIKCKLCGSEFNPEKSTRIYCSQKCADISRRKVKERPTKESLEQDIKNISFCGIGRKYNVSDNAVRKWAKSYGIIL